MDTHEPVPMTRRRYRSIVAAAEDAARTTAAAMAAAAADVASGVDAGDAVLPAPGTSGPLTLMVRPRLGQVPVVPSPRTRRRASIRRSVQPLAS